MNMWKKILIIFFCFIFVLFFWTLNHKITRQYTKSFNDKLVCEKIKNFKNREFELYSEYKLKSNSVAILKHRTNYTYLNGYIFGGFLNNRPNLDIIDIKNSKIVANLAAFANKPEVYFLLPNYYMHETEYFVVDKSNTNNPIQGCNLNENVCGIYNLPKEVKNSKLHGVLQINYDILLFLFTKNSNLHIVMYSYPDYRYRMKYLGKIHITHENNTYILFKHDNNTKYQDERSTPNQIQLLEISHINKDNFNCDDLLNEKKLSLINIKIK